MTVLDDMRTRSAILRADACEPGCRQYRGQTRHDSACRSWAITEALDMLDVLLRWFT